jgi:S1-C subfamily serine protease
MTDRMLTKRGMNYVLAVAVLCLSSAVRPILADPLADTVARIKPSIVGIGTFQKTRNPAASFSGTGFVVADGLHVVTNAHVVPRELNFEAKESLAVILIGPSGGQHRSAQVIAIDKARDLALLQIEGPALRALRIGDSSTAREGQSMAFIGFPVAMALGLYPATHRATLAALVPIARAGITGKELNPRLVTRLRDPYVIFQLDATAYPGNSGSPLFDPATGDVYGILNSVFIRETREQSISRPSGIAYAIPAVHIKDLLEQANLR